LTAKLQVSHGVANSGGDNLSHRMISRVQCIFRVCWKTFIIL